MVNANRDHISTNNLGKHSEDARDMFSQINEMARQKYA